MAIFQSEYLNEKHTLVGLGIDGIFEDLHWILKIKGVRILNWISLEQITLQRKQQ